MGTACGANPQQRRGDRAVRVWLRLLAVASSWQVRPTVSRGRGQDARRSPLFRSERRQQRLGQPLRWRPLRQGSAGGQRRRCVQRRRKSTRRQHEQSAGTSGAQQAPHSAHAQPLAESCGTRLARRGRWCLAGGRPTAESGRVLRHRSTHSQFQALVLLHDWPEMIAVSPEGPSGENSQSSAGEEGVRFKDTRSRKSCNKIGSLLDHFGALSEQYWAN